MVNIPNLLTALRLVLAPVIAYDVCARKFSMAFTLFLVAALTDWLDGMLARKLRITTQIGAYFDPIADKVLMGAVFISLAASGIAPWWFIMVVLGRDIGILVAASALLKFTKVRELSPSKWGKLSTFVQMIAAPMLIAAEISPTMISAAAIAVRISVALTIWSAVHYAFQSIRLVRES